MWFNRGLPRSCADFAVGPSLAPQAFYRREGVLATDSAGESDPSTCQLGGLVYYDGSCDNREVPIMSRASWGIVEVDDNGKVLASLSGNVPATMPQTPQFGEHLAHGYAVQYP